jgi:Tol biopolymer transport system component
MTTSREFERTVAAWLRDDADRSFPDQLDALLERTVATRQRAWWSSPERWLPMDTTFTGRMSPTMRPSWLLVVLLLVAAMVATIILVGSRQRPLPAPYGPAENGAILYSVNGDIYTAQANGQDARVLIGGDAIDHAPVISNDGTRFIFFRETSPDRFDLLAASIDGREIRKLLATPVERPTWADWSPDGDEVLVLHVDAGRQRLSLVATDGSLDGRQIETGGVAPTWAMWRPPDGREIVFGGVEHDRVALYVASADGAAVRAVAPAKPDLGFYIAPRLSPDGTRVTYWHNQFVNAADHPEGRKSEVHVLDLRTGEDVRVGHDPTSRHELHPRFSPDGRSILFVRFNRIPDTATLHIVDADDSEGLGRQIGPPQAWGVSGALEEPVLEFSPDGSKVILSFGSASRGQIIDIATGAVEQADFADFMFWQRAAR